MTNTRQASAPTELESVTVTDSRTYQFPVEVGQVLQFARAVGEIPLGKDQPGLTDVAARTPAPTFLVGADVFDPLCPRRPVPGVTYPVRPVPKEAGEATSQRRGFHAQQTFEFRRPPRIGEVLTVETGIGRTWSRPGSTGRLNFTEHLTAFTDSDGERVATTCWLKVMIPPTTEAEPAAPAKEQRPDTSAGVPADGAAAGEDAGTVETWSEIVVPEVTLSHLVMYAGASGDYIPMHHDDQVARTAGYDGVFAHGMWTMGVTARAISPAVATENLRRYSARMRAPVWLGDTLTTEVVATRPAAGSAPSGSISLVLETRNQHGDVVLSAEAVGDETR
ncbi:MaoC/PaaZ C-terminal domain-containing protein [Blastococcus sp. URHD0036]|uniref:MaoC/PaaZ C-terminal domain-containing protein n=1 Tax=Blastococcus sp. URHD0036 TaxID=1380356 RepID=UPI000494FF95|nr:MaoC/PaaZ C-terminal domain-containing protein [Blastococcus sp. URHD0036]